MYAILTAGGKPQPGDPLYPYTQGNYKALIDIAGKPMIQWVLDALEMAGTIEKIVLVGLDPSIRLNSTKITSEISNQGDMLDNIRAGVRKVLQESPQARRVALVSSDIPAISGEMVDDVVESTFSDDLDIYYNVITRQVMESRFPLSKRSYTHLKDMEVCGGDLNIIRTITVTENDQLWKKIIAARKNVLKQAAMIGYDTLFLLLMKRITLDQAVTSVTRRLDITGRAILCPYAEIGMDIDKPHQLEIIRKDLESRG